MLVKYHLSLQKLLTMNSLETTIINSIYIHSYLRNPDMVGTDPLSGFAKIPDFTSLRNPD